MTINLKQSYLSQTYKDNWHIYSQTIESEHNLPIWDIFIITASNDEQAEAYRIQINYRLENGYLPKGTKYIVVADPEGKRIGSGGATINALYEALGQEFTEHNNPFVNKRVAIIHSGGDSKRVPQYSAFGKLFSRVPRELPDGRYSTLFDEFFISLSGIPLRMNEGVIVASGDVLLLFNHNQIDLGRQGAIGIGIKVPAIMGSNHGVYLTDSKLKVRKFLHKMNVEKLTSVGAVDNKGLVNVDTGLLWLDSEVSYKLLNIIMTNGILDKEKYDFFINETIRLNFYGDFLIPFTQEGVFEEYLKEECEGEYNNNLIEARKIIWNTFNSHEMHVQALAPAEFIHFGTTMELRNLMSSADLDFDFLSWNKDVVSFQENENLKNKGTLINTYLGEKVSLGNNIFIEDSKLTQCEIGNGCVLSNIKSNEFFKLNEDLVLHSLPIEIDGQEFYITRVYGVYDNPKNLVEDATFLNNSFWEFIEATWVSQNDLWNDGIENSLWNAKLYPLCSTREESLKFALMISNIKEASPSDIEEWLKKERFSLKESYEMANQKAILNSQLSIEDNIRIRKFAYNALQGIHINDLENTLGTNKEQVQRRVTGFIQYVDSLEISLDRARLYKFISRVMKNHKIDNWLTYENKCYSDINTLISVSTKTNLSKVNSNKKRVDISSPVRVNFGGGWSDTPPYTLECGGTVLNAAISLNGELPIRTFAEFLNEPVIKLTSCDLDVTKTFTTLEQLQNYNDPSDPLALHKAALVVTGILPTIEETQVTFEDIIEKLGGGIHLYTEVHVPKGSGLGTSSILAATLIKSIFELIDIEYDYQRIFDEVLLLEQLLTTGGGWQDQVGGLVPGVKLVSTTPGLSKKIEIQQLNISDRTIEELNDRLVVLFTGQRRLAKGILRDIMGDYILNTPEKLHCLNEIQKLAVMMKYELEKGNIDSFADLLNKHTILSRRLDKGSTNTYIDQIIKICEPYISGLMICGAGGGGFLQLILKSKEHKEPLRKVLEDIFQENNVGLWDCELYMNNNNF